GYSRFVQILAAHLAHFGFSPKILTTDQAEAAIQRSLHHCGPDDEGLFPASDLDAGLVPARANPRIHIWVPDYESATGGIQVFSRFLVRAIADSFPEGQITVLSKNDSSFPVRSEEHTLNSSTRSS